MKINQDNAKACLIELLEISGIPGKEKKVAERIVTYFNTLGIENYCFDEANVKAGGEVGNLILDVPGAGSLKDSGRVMLSGHMDTVPLCAEVKLIEEDGIIKTDGKTALGADNRTACAAIISVVRELKEQKLPHPPLTLVFTVQEEIGLVGASHLDYSLLKSPKFGINIDGGIVEEMLIGAIGGIKFEAVITGIASHAGVHPEDGVSAASVFALAQAKILSDGWHGVITKGTKEGRANIGSVHGGAATNVVMDELTFTGECRSHDLEFRDEIYQTYIKYFQEAASQVTNAVGESASVNFTLKSKSPSFAIAPNNTFITDLSEHFKEMGLSPELIIGNGGLDANYFNHELGVPVVTIGAGAHNIHTVKEYCQLQEYYTCCEFLLKYLSETK